MTDFLCVYIFPPYHMVYLYKYVFFHIWCIRFYTITSASNTNTVILPYFEMTNVAFYSVAFHELVKNNPIILCTPRYLNQWPVYLQVILISDSWHWRKHWMSSSSCKSITVKSDAMEGALANALLGVLWQNTVNACSVKVASSYSCVEVLIFPEVNNFQSLYFLSQSEYLQRRFMMRGC